MDNLFNRATHCNYCLNLTITVTCVINKISKCHLELDGQYVGNSVLTDNYIFCIGVLRQTSGIVRLTIIYYIHSTALWTSSLPPPLLLYYYYDHVCMFFNSSHRMSIPSQYFLQRFLLWFSVLMLYIFVNPKIHISILVSYVSNLFPVFSLSTFFYYHKLLTDLPLYILHLYLTYTLILRSHRSTTCYFIFTTSLQAMYYVGVLFTFFGSYWSQIFKFTHSLSGTTHASATDILSIEPAHPWSNQTCMALNKIPDVTQFQMEFHLSISHCFWPTMLSLLHSYHGYDFLLFPTHS